MKKILKFIIYIFGPLILGGIVALFTSYSSYNAIEKPPFSPPGIVFPIVWSILYLLMGISFYIVNKSEIRSVRWYLIQLILNLIWPFLFFQFKLFIFSAIWIVALEFFVVLMIDSFKKQNKTSAYLQIPYFIWLLLALYLNIGVAILN